jgi:hypothetical protein
MRLNKQCVEICIEEAHFFPNCLKIQKTGRFMRKFCFRREKRLSKEQIDRAVDKISLDHADTNNLLRLFLYAKEIRFDVV